jgi:hypothetical protein
MFVGRLSACICFRMDTIRPVGCTLMPPLFGASVVERYDCFDVFNRSVSPESYGATDTLQLSIRIHWHVR